MLDSVRGGLDGPRPPISISYPRWIYNDFTKITHTTYVFAMTSSIIIADP